jgi:hypothetical protein
MDAPPRGGRPEESRRLRQQAYMVGRPCGPPFINLNNDRDHPDMPGRQRLQVIQIDECVRDASKNRSVAAVCD